MYPNSSSSSGSIADLLDGPVQAGGPLLDLPRNLSSPNLSQQAAAAPTFDPLPS